MNSEKAKSVYVHIPFCNSKCSYCGFFSRQSKNYDLATFKNAVIKEIESRRGKIADKIETLYIGGGSPASIGKEKLCLLLKKIAEILGRAEEFTIELNPADINMQLLKNLKEIGVNRISVGLQSFDENILKFFNRKYKPEQIYQAIETAKKTGFNNISIDLIFAIPDTDMDYWKRQLHKAVELDIQHISAYSLSYEENTVLYNKLKTGKITAIDEQLDCDMYLYAIDFLAENGFGQYEISNFAKENFRCRHNVNCWKNKYYIGIAPAAHSYYKNMQWENPCDINKYINSEVPAEKITLGKLEIACRQAVLNLRMLEGINLAEYKKQTGFDLYELFAESIKKNLDSKLLKKTENNIRLTKIALPIADKIMCDFAEKD